MAGYKGALGRRGRLPWPRALPGCAHHLSPRRAGSAAAPGDRCGATSEPPVPAAGSPPSHRCGATSNLPVPVRGQLRPTGAGPAPTLLAPGAGPAPTRRCRCGASSDPAGAQCAFVPARLSPELPGARSQLPSRCSQTSPGHSHLAGPPFPCKHGKSPSAGACFRHDLMSYYNLDLTSKCSRFLANRGD